MIKSIEIKNFKSIKRKAFSLRKLNLLFGLNGMGKSSFIQSLLCIRQSSDIFSGRLDLKGKYFNLGTTKDVLYQYSKGEDLSFQFKFSDSQELNLQFKYEPEADYFLTKDNVLDFYGEPSKLQYLKKESLFGDNFQYLNANRVPPQSNHPKHFTSVVKLRSIGNFGEHTAHFIETFYGEEIQFDSLLHKNSKIKDELLGKEIINKTLINQINLWMGEISPDINIRTTSISSDEVLLEYVYKQPFYGNTNRFKPENVGFGISYSLHVVTSLLASKPGQLLIIENPESHVHPRGQAEIGKLIALAAINDVQIVIETHSDHILNGIRVAIKENTSLKDETMLFYFDKIVSDSEQYSKISDIIVDMNGTLSEYPENLLTEWSNQLSKLI